jgi:hypothetical protein
MMEIFDYIVVGSGCSGAMAAQTLTEAGASVLMLDAGYRPKAKTQVPDKNFLTLRKSDTRQHTYFIGSKGDGIRWGDVSKGEQITPPRDFIMKGASTYLPVESSTFEPLQSLAYGGLGSGWGLQCWKYSDYDLDRAGLDATAMHTAYDVVSERIGISATNDDAAGYTINGLKSYQPSPRMDHNHERMAHAYKKRKRSLLKRGLILGRTPLALITKDLGKRRRYKYKGMDFYSDTDLSAWRPWITIDSLRKRKNFTYQGGLLVTHYVEKKQYTEIHALTLTTHIPKVFRCKKLVLAAGTLNSGRIVLRSNHDYRTKLPLLCNPYRYVPCIQPRFVGKSAEKNKLTFTQLSLFLDKKQRNEDVSVSSIYSYQSLMLFRVIRNLPLNLKDGRIVTQYLVSGLILIGIHHPDEQSKNKYVRLKKSPETPTGDILYAEHQLSESEAREYKQRDKAYIKAMRRLGVYGFKAIDPGNGASIHYAGTLPYSDKPKKYHLQANGRLHGTKRIYVADSSGFNYLPAKGLTFSLMANAHLVALGALNRG